MAFWQVQEPDDVFEGNLKTRKIRDVICLGLFAVFLGLMVGALVPLRCCT